MSDAPAPATPAVAPPTSPPTPPVLPPGQTTPPAAPPAKPPTSGTPAPPPKPPTAPPPIVRPPRSGNLRDDGVGRRESVHALTWSVEGTVKVTGEVDSGAVSVRGALSVGGAILVDTLSCRGNLDAGATLTVAAGLTSHGELRSVGAVRAQRADLTGTTRLGGDITVESTLATGGQFAAASVHAGEFRGDGAVIVPGSFEAGTVDVHLRADSRFGMIRARSVRLVRSAPNPIEMVFGRSPPSRVDRVEADRVELEGVEVAFVRSPEVILGRDAHVTELEGTVVRRHRSATVGPRSKSPRPYGLSR
jgi:cytoskeletal protein CcmA (bactofilin family)